MSFLEYSRNFKGVVDVFMHDPSGYLPFAQLMAAIMSGTNELSKPQCEMIALRVSALNHCHYCVGSHRAVLANMGVDAATISSAESGHSVDAILQALLDFAAKLATSPGQIAQSDVDAVRQSGWSDQSVEDVIRVVSLFSFLNRLVDGLGIKGNAEGFAQAGGMIAEHGYHPVVQMLQGKTT
jgi:uncharacterized peroxidase-related enzyme